MLYTVVFSGVPAASVGLLQVRIWPVLQLVIIDSSVNVSQQRGSASMLLDYFRLDLAFKLCF
jgi:hypothetical protein